MVCKGSVFLPNVRVQSLLAEKAVRKGVTYLSWHEQEVENVKNIYTTVFPSFLPCLQARPFTSPVILYETLSLLHHCTAQ